MIVVPTNNVIGSSTVGCANKLRAGFFFIRYAVALSFIFKWNFTITHYGKR
ncbi:hypothetical protein GCM10011517_07670 [Actibacterium pelagium]|uniref:Uncharacterized protein n=1 Tax=Actibacterium pelagium TaxID=2029103 RepID=A0A917AEG0_9RHOB|nr:hypothetical protein GCM10011517_07670 [Actibacterium pelagium]